MDEEYFKPIHFSPVEEYDPRKMDKAIVEQAVKQLRKDLNAGYNHILMARVKDKSRAREIIALYRQYPEFDPVQLHTGIAKKERQRIKSQVLSGKSKIVVCVDMLGEGFDLPELKIVYRSLYNSQVASLVPVLIWVSLRSLLILVM
jgi:superfamily II DNA or RNA helicase